jgi:N-glycosylase/DNA lyase
MRDYNFKGLGKKQVSLTDKTYKLVGDSFREVFGPYTGWAHSVLFAADLKHLQELVQQEEQNNGVKREHDMEIPVVASGELQTPPRSHKKIKLEKE